MSLETERKVIATHSDEFQCAEAFACFLIQQLPEYKDAEIKRTRKVDELDQCDIVVDVGQVYDPARNRFDYRHTAILKNTLADLFPEKKFGNVPLSAAGLVYGHFGHRVIGLLCEWSEDDPRTGKIFDMLYVNFVKEIDALEHSMPLYRIRTDLTQRVKHLLPCWNEDQKDLDNLFLKAVELTGIEFKQRLHYYRYGWLPARQHVLEAFETRFEVDPSGKILIFQHKFLPWTEHFFQIEEELGLTGSVYYVILPHKQHYRIYSVDESKENWKPRKPFPQTWVGLKNEDLVRVCAVKGAIFVFDDIFAGAKTPRAAIEMARKMLQS